MSAETRQKGFADGFFSFTAFFLPPAKKRRQSSEPFVPHQTQALPDISVAAAWGEVGSLCSEAMARLAADLDLKERGSGHGQSFIAKAGRK